MMSKLFYRTGLEYRGSISLVLLVLAISISLVGCGNQSSQDDDGIPLVVVNGDQITQQELALQFQVMDQPSQENYSSREGMLRLMDDMVSVELLYQEAQRRKIDEQPVVKFDLERMRKDLMINELIRQSVNQSELFKLFQLNFVRPRTIFVRAEEPGTASDKKAKKKIEALYKKIQDGADFEQLARDESDSPNAEESAGDMGYLDRELAIRIAGIEFQDALFDLKKVGDVSKPVRGNYGYFIIQLLEARGNLSQAPPVAVKRRMEQKRQDEIYMGYISDLKSRPETKIERNTDNIKAFLDMMDKELEKTQAVQADDTQSPEPEEKKED